MSHELIFTIIPFDPLIIPNAEIHLPIDFDDFANRLREKLPDAEVVIVESAGEVMIRSYITTEKYGRWNLATYIKDYSQFDVKGWPKRMAKELIFWYRQYVPMNYPLFLVIPSSGYVAELTARTTLDDIEGMYPFPVSDD